MPEKTLEIFEITSWLWGLRTPLVQAYAVRNGDGFNLIDTGIAGGEDAILSSLPASTVSRRTRSSSTTSSSRTATMTTPERRQRSETAPGRECSLRR